MQKDFETFAGSACGVGSTTLGRYGAVLNSRINPTIIEERQLNVAAMDVFSRLMMDRIIFLGVPIDDDVATAKSQLDGALRPGDLSFFRFTPTRTDIMVKFLDRRTDRIRMFRLRYDRLADDIARVKTWYNTQGPGGDKDYLSRCAIALPCTM